MNDALKSYIEQYTELKPGPPDCDRACLERRCAVLGSELFIGALNGYDAGWKLVSQLHLTGDLTDTVASEC